VDCGGNAVRLTCEYYVVYSGGCTSRVCYIPLGANKAHWEPYEIVLTDSDAAQSNNGKAGRYAPYGMPSVGQLLCTLAPST
jgi:hypothetical protein